MEDKSLLSYRPLLSEDVTTAIGLARPTVNSRMIEQHRNFAGQYSMLELNDIDLVLSSRFHLMLYSFKLEYIVYHGQ